MTAQVLRLSLDKNICMLHEWQIKHKAQRVSAVWFSALCVCVWRCTRDSVSRQEQLPIAQIPALLDHVQDVGLSAGAGQTREKEDRRPGGRVGMREAVIVVKPVQRDLSSICCLNKLTAGTSGTRKSAQRTPLNIILSASLYIYSHTHCTNRRDNVE